jgi:hypothetical protein
MQGCKMTCACERAYRSVAGSLIPWRSQFAHAAHKKRHFEIFELIFSQSVIRNKFVLDRIALSGEPSKIGAGQRCPKRRHPILQIFLTALFFAEGLDKRACCVG